MPSIRRRLERCVAEPVRRWRGSFRDEQTCRRACSVVASGPFTREVARCARTRHRRHHDAVGEVKATELERREQHVHAKLSPALAVPATSTWRCIASIGAIARSTTRPTSSIVEMRGKLVPRGLAEHCVVTVLARAHPRQPRGLGPGRDRRDERAARALGFRRRSTTNACRRSHHRHCVPRGTSSKNEHACHRLGRDAISVPRGGLGRLGPVAIVVMNAQHEHASIGFPPWVNDKLTRRARAPTGARACAFAQRSG